MTDKFEVGEIAISVYSVRGEQPGFEVEIVAGLDWRDSIHRGYVECYLVRKHGDLELYAALPQQLRKRRPPREPTVDWSECAWRPERELS